jgi:hypothetical protein
VTTLRVYSAFRPEADDRAATTLGSRLPLPPGVTATNSAPVANPDPADDSAPYKRIAADLRGAIARGAFAEGDVSVGTAQRAVAHLASTSHVAVRSGYRSLVRLLTPKY